MWNQCRKRFDSEPAVDKITVIKSVDKKFAQHLLLSMDGGT